MVVTFFLCLLYSFDTERWKNMDTGKKRSKQNDKGGVEFQNISNQNLSCPLNLNDAENMRLFEMIPCEMWQPTRDSSWHGNFRGSLLIPFLHPTWLKLISVKDVFLFRNNSTFHPIWGLELHSPFFEAWPHMERGPLYVLWLIGLQAVEHCLSTRTLPNSYAYFRRSNPGILHFCLL